MNQKYLSIYLNDHLAGSTAGFEVAKRSAAANEGTELGSFLSDLAGELEDERARLRAIMAHLGIAADRIKVGVAWTGEKLGRLKPNGHVRTRSPYSQVVEFEVLLLGVTGKLAMWHVLAEGERGLESFGLEALIAQAEDQRDELETRRMAAAVAAFG